MIDPLDLGEAHQKGWEEFRLSFVGAFQHTWLLDELERLAPQYTKELEPKPGGENRIHLVDGTELTLSRAHRDAFRRGLEGRS